MVPAWENAAGWKSRNTLIRDQRLLDEKWGVLRRRARQFAHVPFVEFALGSGSMALGTARPSSDFDVIVGVRGGRIFTARFLCVAAFALRGWRRARYEHGADARDKICLSHFVAPGAYRFAPPHTEAWRAMYRGLAPLTGNPIAIAAFFSANEWAWERHGGQEAAVRAVYSPRRWKTHRHPRSLIRAVGEFILGGAFGDAVENALRRMQVRRIQKNMRHEDLREPRIAYTDHELMFFPDSRSRLTDYEEKS